MRVLIADDRKDVGTTLADLVRACNHEVVEVVGSGIQAIAAYHRHLPDIVLMDYYMPGLNGATACRNIRARDPGARIVFVSGLFRQDFSDSGAIAMLSKPVDIAKLEHLLHEQPTAFHSFSAETEKGRVAA